ncbi:transposase [Actinoallomurus sp. NPDC050550]|uniref:transposase n=1 Tax=Actinoallomurus sp. NPDC050550 TaxID=3154937 RepID=UPI0033E70566
MALEVLPDLVHVFVKHDQKSSASCVANPFEGLTSRVLRQEFPRLQPKLPTLRSSYLAASAGAVSAETVRRYVDTQSGRHWKKAGGS